MIRIGWSRMYVLPIGGTYEVREYSTDNNGRLTGYEVVGRRPTYWRALLLVFEEIAV